MVCLLAHWNAQVDAAQCVCPLPHCIGLLAMPSVVFGGRTVEREQAVRNVFVCTFDHEHEIFQVGEFQRKIPLPCEKVSVRGGEGWTCSLSRLRGTATDVFLIYCCPDSFALSEAR